MLLINGVWCEGEGELFTSENPASGEVIWQGREPSPQQVVSAVTAAEQAFSLWSALSFEERASCVHRFTAAVQAERDSLAIAIAQENGKPLWEARTEVDAIIGKGDISIASYQERCKEIHFQQGATHCSGRHRPWGVVAVLGPFNFPCHLPNSQLLPALLSGNCVVLKPSEKTPRAGELLCRLWERGGLPPGVLSLLQGGRAVGAAIAQEARLNALYFTGSVAVGRHLAAAWSHTPERILALELGGNAPLVVGRGVEEQLSAAGQIIVQSAFLSAGQRCISARRLFLPRGESGAAVLRELQGLVATLRVGSYDSLPEPYLGPLIDLPAAQKVINQYALLVRSGATVISPLNQLQKGRPFLTPAIVDVTECREAISDEELFGPLLLVMRIDGFQERLQAAAATRYGLAAGFLGTDAEEYRRFSSVVRAGVVSWNRPTTGVSGRLPFGGVGISGNGRPSGWYAVDSCSYPVAYAESQLLSAEGLLPLR